jgi:hypothetical protein
MNGNRHEAVRFSDFVSALDVITDFHAQLRGFSSVLAQGQHNFFGILHAPNGEMARELLLLGRVNAVTEAASENHRGLN